MVEKRGCFGRAVPLPEWFTRRGVAGSPGHDNDAMALFYFDQLRHMAAVRSVDEVESDVSGGMNPS